MLLPLLLLQAAAAAPPDSVPGRGAPAFALPRLEAEVRVDGALDEAVWARAARLVGFHAFQPDDGRPAEERTEVLLWYAPDALHVGIRAYDSQPGTVRATLADRDRIGQEDRVTLYLDTFDDRRRAFLFAVNPLGVQQDGVRAEGSAGPGRPFGGSTDLSPDYQWESAGRRTEWGWEAELRIPFKSLRYAGGDEQRWGIQVSRDIQRTGREDTWTDARRGAASFLAQSGTMTGIHDLRRGIVLEAQPFVTATTRGARAAPSAPLRRDDPVASTGVNARLGFASAALDLTVNPDFSQVESDAGLVTANERFSLFVPERRPFFLEGIELFASPTQLVYTRRIADPVAGAKLTGKVGPWGYAYLSALDETGAGARDALFNVARVRRDVLRNSLVGVTVTDRRAGGVANTVAAADARLVFGKYYVEAQAGGSRTDLGPPASFDAPVAQGGTAATVAPLPVDRVRSGAILNAELDRTGRSWGFNYSVESTERDFRADAGFIPRTGITSGRAFNRLTWFGRPGALLETVRATFGPSYLWRTGDLGDGPIEGSETASVTARFRRGWQVEVNGGRAFADFVPADYAGYVVGPADAPFVAAPGVRGLATTRLEVTTPVFRRANASLSVGRGAVPLFAEATEGRSREAELDVDLRPTTQLRGALSAVWQTLERQDGSEFARTIIPRLRVEYQPRRSLFFRTIAQYRAERRAPLRDPATGLPLRRAGAPIAGFETNGLRLEWLASYEPTPGTVAFLGYAVDLTEPDPLAFGRLRAVGDGAFLKLAYLFRR